jgi:hypothetical protein
MERDSWKIPYATFLVCVVGFAVWSSTSPGLCTAPPLEKALADKELGWCFEFWLNRYQTLIAGVFALVGAFLTVQAVRGQIQQADRLEEERRERESYAARAALPLALSGITITHSSACTRFWQHTQLGVQEALSVLSH